MKGIAANQWAWKSEANRPAEEKTLETFLSEAAQSGYDAVEYLDEGLGEAARRHGLSVCGAYASAPFHLSWDELNAELSLIGPARQVAELGGEYLSVNCDPKGRWNNRERKTKDELKRQGENMSRLAKEVEPLGVRILMHNHANHPDLHYDDLRSVTEYAAPSVGVCLDTGWALTSLDDPVGRARSLGDRLGGLHLRNQVGPVPTEWLGEGEMDVAAFIAVLKEIGYEHWLTTELWHRNDTAVTRSLLEDQEQTVELLRKLWNSSAD